MSDILHALPAGDVQCQSPWMQLWESKRMQGVAEWMLELAADRWHHGCMQVSQDEEKLQKARLEVKRGLPLQDLSGNKGFPEDARMQAQVRGARDMLQSW